MPGPLPEAGPVLVLAPSGRDAEGARLLLERAGIRIAVQRSAADLLEALSRNDPDQELPGTVLVAVEALARNELRTIEACLAAQPAWSDLPFIVLTHGTATSRRSVQEMNLVGSLGNVMFLERPLHAVTLVSAVQSALRARRRQLQVRDHVLSREAAAAALRESEASLRTALKAGHLGSWSLELATLELTASAACKASFGRGEADDFTYDDLVAAIHPDDREAQRAALAAAIADEQDYNVEYRIRWPDGSEHWVEVRGRTVYASDDGRPLRMIGVSLDTTERRRAAEDLQRLNQTLENRVAERTRELVQAQEALVQAQKMEAVGQLTGGIAHDFNNLLTAVVGGLDIIQRRASDERIKRLAANALEAAERGTKLTSQLLAFSRTQRLALAIVDVNAIISGMQELLTSSIGTSPALQFDLDPEAGAVMTDGNQLELAILNLAINARDALQTRPDKSRGGAITIATSRSSAADRAVAGLSAGDYVVISVADNGPGMPQDVAARAFDPFFTTKPVGQGTGLGLSQVYGMARQSAGAAMIDSKPGSGTTVRIYLPRTSAIPDEPGNVVEPDRLPPQADGLRATILVVDDDPDARRFTVEALRASGYHVLAAEDGESGLELIRRVAPDAALLDFAMPGMNGTELWQATRQLLPDLPVSFITGYADTAALDAVVGTAGQVQVLRKPFRLSELLATVQSMLDRDRSLADQPR